MHVIENASYAKIVYLWKSQLVETEENCKWFVLKGVGVKFKWVNNLNFAICYSWSAGGKHAEKLVTD